MAEIYEGVSLGLQITAHIYRAWKTRRDRRKSASQVIKEVATNESCAFAMPIVNDLDEIYIYSPYNLTRRTIQPYNISAIVEFDLWATSGYLYLKATDLSFTFALPILSQDQVYDQCLSGPLRNWQSRNSDRFYLVKLYLASAADAACGECVSVGSFRSKMKNLHHEIKIVTNSRSLISVEISDTLDKSFPSCKTGQKWYATIA